MLRVFVFDVRRRPGQPVSRLGEDNTSFISSRKAPLVFIIISFYLAASIVTHGVLIHNSKEHQRPLPSASLQSQAQEINYVGHGTRGPVAGSPRPQFGPWAGGAARPRVKGPYGILVVDFGRKAHNVESARGKSRRTEARERPRPSKKALRPPPMPISLSTGIDAQSRGSTEKNYTPPPRVCGEVYLTLPYFTQRAVAQHDSRDRHQGAGDGFLRSRRPHHRSSHTTTKKYNKTPSHKTGPAPEHGRSRRSPSDEWSDE